MNREVSVIIKELRKRKGMSQDGLAEYLNAMQPIPKDSKDLARYVRSGDIQRLEAAGRNLKKQFMIFLKILPMCLELDLITERDLLREGRHDTKPNPSPGKTPKIKADRRQS